MKDFRHVVQETDTADHATVTCQGDEVGVCIDSGRDTADLLLTPDQAREMANALLVAAFVAERE